jgi:tetratricopeptide (TPR) repeat protein
LRQAVLAKDWEAVRRLARERPQGENWTPARCVLMADVLRWAGVAEQSREVPRQGVQQHPGDFWRAFELAYAAQDMDSSVAREGRCATTLRLPRCGRITQLSTVIWASSLIPRGRWPRPSPSSRRRSVPNPTPARLIATRGKALCAQRKSAEASAAFREALRLNPDDPATHYNLGRVLQHQGKLAYAIARFEGSALPPA